MNPEPAARRSGLAWWGGLATIVAAAAAVRLCSLGTFSLDLDEILTMTRAAPSFPEMIARCAADPDNTPLHFVIIHFALRLGLVDPWIRLIPIAAGLASIVAWSWWTRRHFGDPAGLLLAGFLALSTFHVRYSQELRAYPFLLLVTALTMLAADRVRSRPGFGSSALLAAAVAVGWYLHFSVALVFAPLVGMVAFGDDDGHRRPDALRRTLAWTAAAIVAGTLVFLPWFLHVRTTLSNRISRGATDWTVELITRRWQFLTVAAHESESADWLGGILAALAVIGLGVAIRRRAGRAALLPALAAVVAGEAALVAVNRWSQGRYDTAAWPLLVVLVVLGGQWIGERMRRRWLQAVMLAILACSLLVRVDAYHRLGRPHWDRVAAAVAEVRRPGEPVLTENTWSQVCLSYYSEHPVESLHRSSGELAAALARHSSVLLLAPARYRQPAVQAMARRGVTIADVPRTGRLIRLRPDMLRLAPPPSSGQWPEPAAALVPDAIESAPRGCLSRILGCGDEPPHAPPWSRLELDEHSSPFLRSGWSAPKSTGAGASIRLVTGTEAVVVAPRPAAGPARISLRASSLRELDRQELRLLVNGCDLGTTALEQAPLTAIFDAPAECWQEGRNLVVLQFRKTLEPGAGRELPRAAAIDWIEIAPPLPAAAPASAP